MTYERETEQALTATATAAQLCEQIRTQRQYDILEKADSSPVTIADLGAQALICRAIAQAFPEDPVVAEESASLLRQAEQAPQLASVTQYVQSLISDATPETVLTWIDRGTGRVGHRFWTLDPIDGTKGFLRNDQYAIALALVEAGQVQLGVVACPLLPVDPKQPEGKQGVFFLAVRGQGATQIAMGDRSSQPIHVVTDPRSPAFRPIESVESGHGNRPLQRQVAAQVGLTAPPLQMDSLAKYGAIARGQAVLYLRLPWVERPGYQENIWDHAAGAILVEEAGGVVTDMEGRSLDFAAATKLIHNRGIVASNGILHAAVLQHLQAH